MTERSNAAGGLPRRDLWLLPLISLLTVASMLCVSEIAARQIWPENEDLHCTGPDGRENRNCTAYAKNAEGPRIGYYFNDCGYRTPEPCGPKPPGSLRVVVLGTSVAQGWAVPYEQTFSARAALGLTASLGRPVEFQNLGSLAFPLQSAENFIPQALALQADAILLVVTPWDLSRFDPGFRVNRDPANPPDPPTGGFTFRKLMQRARLITRRSRALLMVQHYLLLDQDTTIDLYRSYSNPNDVIQQRWSGLCVRRFAAFESTLDRIGNKLRGSKIPFVLVLVPSRIQAALLSSGERLPGIDPYLSFRKMSQAAQVRGFEFLDLSAEFRATPHAADLYYPVDSHPAGQANGIVARALIRYLTAGRQAVSAKTAYGLEK